MSAEYRFLVREFPVSYQDYRIPPEYIPNVQHGLAHAAERKYETRSLLCISIPWPSKQNCIFLTKVLVLVKRLVRHHTNEDNTKELYGLLATVYYFIH
jgi:hypothetical protein